MAPVIRGNVRLNKPLTRFPQLPKRRQPLPPSASAMASNPKPPAMGATPEPPAAAAVLPPRRDWVMLDRFTRRRDDGSFPDDAGPARSTTAASCANSLGDTIGVYLRLAAPPAPSTVYARWPDGCEESSVVDAVYIADYLVYIAGGGGAPSLRLIPPLGGTVAEVRARVAAEGYRACVSPQTPRRMDSRDVGVLCRGAEDTAVAELEITRRPKVGADLHVIRPSTSCRWELKRPPVVPVHRKDLDLEHLLWYWDTDAVVPFGTRLCWVDFSRGILLCEVFDESPDLLYLELPAKFRGLNVFGDHGRGTFEKYQTVGVTDGGSTMRFVNIVRDDDLVAACHAPAPGFTITTWTLRITEGDSSMVWEKDVVVTADELWALDSFAHLPRGMLSYPVFSLDGPGVICFVLNDKGRAHKKGTYNYSDFWLVAIDMINKTLKSMVLYIKQGDDQSHDEAELFDRKIRCFESFIPCELPHYLNLRDTRIEDQMPDGVGGAEGDRVIRHKMLFEDTRSSSRADQRSSSQVNFVCRATDQGEGLAASIDFSKMLTAGDMQSHIY
ncbi:hypothetical protein ACP70R_018714 [Stipagrostis hirtigluma subsp. patula]